MESKFTRQDLVDMIKEIYGFDELPKVFDIQINRFVKECKLSFVEIACTLSYMEIKGLLERDADKARTYGAARIPDYAKSAKVFFEAKKRQEEQQRNAAKKSSERDTIEIKNVSYGTTKRKKIDLNNIL